MKRARGRDTRLLVSGFAISLAMHVLLLPLVRTSATAVDETLPPPDLRIVQLPQVRTKPAPTPHAVPTPARAPLAPHQAVAAARLPAPFPAAHPQRARAAVGERRAASGRDTGLGPPGPPAPGDGGPAPAAEFPTPAAAAAPTPALRSCDRPEVPAATLRTVEPELPAFAQQQGAAGTVEVVVSLDAASRIVAVRIARSPNVLLDATALAAARASQFRTATHDCVATAADYLFRVDFGAS